MRRQGQVSRFGSSFKDWSTQRVDPEGVRRRREHSGIASGDWSTQRGLVQVSRFGSHCVRRRRLRGLDQSDREPFRFLLISKTVVFYVRSEIDTCPVPFFHQKEVVVDVVVVGVVVVVVVVVVVGARRT